VNRFISAIVENESEALKINIRSKGQTSRSYHNILTNCKKQAIGRRELRTLSSDQKALKHFDLVWFVYSSYFADLCNFILCYCALICAVWFIT